MTLAVDSDPSVALYFKVSIDGVDLGAFSTCDGLSLDIETEDRIEGGNNSFVHKLPVRIKYGNVKFTRPLGADSAKIASWLSKMASLKVLRRTADITALTPEGRPLVSWHVEGVMPVKWQGPSFSAESPKVAMETLEIAHQGFTFSES